MNCSQVQAYRIPASKPYNEADLIPSDVDKPSILDTQEKYDSRNWTVQQICDLFGVPRSTVYGYLSRTPTS